MSDFFSSFEFELNLALRNVEQCCKMQQLEDLVPAVITLPKSKVRTWSNPRLPVSQKVTSTFAKMSIQIVQLSL